MLFNSYEFIFVFLPITFFLYYYLLSKKLIVGAKVLLVFSSLFFYSWWNIIYLPIILISMGFNYSIGNILSKNIYFNVNKKYMLFFGIFMNLSLLAYFKYVDFFIENFNYITNYDTSLLNIALPLAISFFTFQQISYLVDSYKNETNEYNILNYSLFVSFFPQLIAGPIVHHKEMMPQFSNKWNLVKNYKNISLGIFIFSIGLFKKVVIADKFSYWANNGFEKAEILTLIEGWVTSLSYTFQLYFDFSGYTDMALGVALLFNIKLPINFNSPYKAKNIQDFWRRWHITLSRFLREYVYIPLGGNKLSSIKTYSNLMTTFILGGLWHGAAWTFVFWGFLHGFALIIHRLWKTLGFKMPILLAWFITFNFINISWIFFRAKEWQDAINILKSMFGFNTIEISTKYQDKLMFLSDYGITFGQWLHNIDGSKSVSWIFIIGMILLLSKNSIEFMHGFKANKWYFIFTISIFTYSISVMNKVSEFLYFNF